MKQESGTDSNEQSMYIDLWDYYDESYPFQIFIGGYAMGKSYSGLRGCVNNTDDFIYMRRTQTALEECTTSKRDGDKGNPFGFLNRDLGWNIGIHKTQKKVCSIYHREYDEDGFPEPTGLPIGSAMSLPTIAKVRGSDYENAKIIFYDEFIKEKHEPRMTGEFVAVNRAYETINRNKELRGGNPTHMWLISNAEDIYNPIFIGYGIVADAEKMARKRQEHKYYKSRGLAIHLLKSSEEFLKRKRDTAIMKLMQGTRYYDVGLTNTFANQDYSLVGYRDIRGYRPLCALDFAYVYKKKGSPQLYVTYSPGTCPRFTADHNQDELYFRRRFGVVLEEAYIHGEIIFESYELKAFMLEHFM